LESRQSVTCTEVPLPQSSLSHQVPSLVSQQPGTLLTDVNPALADALRDRYRVERELGSGGMAIVYLAEDVKHRRKVALKVLRGELAATMGPERFLREIEVAARLQHPHILPLHDSGETQGFLYYVMPFVDGHNLRHRISRQGELPIHEAVKVLIEVTDALAYAHSQNVVHRDIKPENILLSGRHALVTDFGVAKAVSEATGRQALTTAGVALGTPAYMAPEQAAGEPHIDQRVDIYALGILGYELVSGRTPFSGRTSQEVLAAHVMQPPVPLGHHRPACPAELENVIMKCLAKRPADRWQTADELLAQLEPLATPSGGTTPTTTRPMKSVSTSSVASGSKRWFAIAALLIAVVGSLLFALNHRSREIRLGRRLQITLASGLELDPALSADGRLVAFVTGPLFRTRLYVRQVEGGNPVAITLEDQGFARMPRWSPDGERLVYSSDRGIELIPALGGTPRVLVQRRPGDWLDAAWSPDGKSIVYALGDSVLVRTVDGNTVRGLGRLNEAHSCSWSPDGRRIACVSGNSQFVRNEDFGNIATSSVWVIPSAGGAPVKVTDDEWLNTSPAWLPGGSSLLYISNREGGRDLYQVDLGRSGRPAHEAVRLSTGLNAATVNVAANGSRLSYATFSRIANVWSLPIPRAGTVNLSRAQPVTNGSQEIEGFDPSPDQRWLVFDSNRGGVQQIYRMQMGGAEVEQLTNGDSPSLAPAFSFDGREVGFHSFREGVRQLFAIQVDGGTPVQVTAEKTHSRIVNWSPDGRSLVFVRNALSPEQETAIVSRDANGRWGAPRTLLKGGAAGVWSPDGTKVATQMQIDRGKFAVAVVPARGGTPRVLGRPQDRQELGWAFSSDSKFVYYIPNTSFGERVGIWRAPVDGGPSQPVAWYDGSPGGLSRSTVRVRGNRLYINIGDPQGDVWVTEIVGR
jgi:eukaryotic-like serine/threonine-protein kinase